MTERQPEEGQRDKPVIHDRRRIDPLTGELRVPSDRAGGVSHEETPAAPATEVISDEGTSVEMSRLQAQLEERTADLQRLQAEYANYRKRVDRDRAMVRDLAVASVLTELLPVVDDVGRAREHGELEGGFKSVGESLESILGKFGLRHFGQRGEPFDPAIHEALVHSFSTEVSEATCVEIFQPGYRLGDRVIRPARVAVAEPEPLSEARSETDGAQQETDDGDLDIG